MATSTLEAQVGFQDWRMNLEPRVVKNLAPILYALETAEAIILAYFESTRYPDYAPYLQWMEYLASQAGIHFESKAFAARLLFGTECAPSAIAVPA